MLKLIGIIAVIAATTGLGILFSHALSKRAAQLEQTVRMIGDIENTIRFQAADIGSIMLELNRQNDYAGLSFIPAFNAGAKSGKSLQESMAGAVSLSQNKMQLNERDCELLRSFFQKLGTTDMEGQIKNCQYYKIRMEEQYREAKTAFEQKGRLYIFLGFFAGLAFALLMI